MFHCCFMEKNQTKHILIVDDSPDQQFLLKMLLEARGYTTECTANGEEALSLLRSKEVMPHTILLDLNMEVMDGAEFRRLQVADPRLWDIPVIVVSGEDDVASIREKMNSEVLKKPLTVSGLLEALERSLKSH